MPQVIAAQRGSTTVSTNGTSSVTLFTQSTGIATRVILNSVTFFTSVNSNLPRMSLCVNINGSGNNTCVAILGASDLSGTGLTMFPNCSPFPLTNITASPNTYIDRWVPMSQSAAGIGTDLTANQWRFAGPNGSSNQSAQAVIEYVPSQFWMNGGDSLVFRCFQTGSPVTATVLYSFTTITET